MNIGSFGTFFQELSHRRRGSVRPIKKCARKQNLIGVKIAYLGYL